METETDDLIAALEWYAAQAEQMQIHVMRLDTKSMEATIKVLSVDGGKRATDAINARRATCPRK